MSLAPHSGGMCRSSPRPGRSRRGVAGARACKLLMRSLDTADSGVLYCVMRRRSAAQLGNRASRPRLPYRRALTDEAADAGRAARSGEVSRAQAVFHERDRIAGVAGSGFEPRACRRAVDAGRCSCVRACAGEEPIRFGEPGTQRPAPPADIRGH